MYVLTTTVQNPVTGESRVRRWEFDPATITQAKFDASVWTTLQSDVTSLTTAAATSEPTTL